MKAIIFKVRMNEFQADRFSVDNGHKEGLIKGLIILGKENKSDLNPDWMYSAFNHTHPPLLQRIKAVKGHKVKSD